MRPRPAAARAAFLPLARRVFLAHVFARRHTFSRWRKKRFSVAFRFAARRCSPGHHCSELTTTPVLSRGNRADASRFPLGWLSSLFMPVNAPSMFRVIPFKYLFIERERERERERESVFSKDENR